MTANPCIFFDVSSMEFFLSFTFSVFCCCSLEHGGVFNAVGVSFACILLSSSSSSDMSLGLSVDVLSSFFPKAWVAKQLLVVS